MARSFDMGLALSQQMRQTQRLIITPQMRQSIELLQMNSLELETLAQQEALENYFLELEESDAGSGADEAEAADAPEAETIDSDEAAPAGTEPTTTEETPQTSEAPDSAVENQASDAFTSTQVAAEERVSFGEEAGAETFKEVDADWDEYFDGNEPTYTSRPSVREAPDEDETDFTEYTAAKTGLRERLQWQLDTAVLEPHLRLIGNYIVNNINDDGYLTIPTIEKGSNHGILKQDPAAVTRSIMEDLGVSEEDVEYALRVIQSFDPTGVGARNLVECLTIQLRDAGVTDRLPYQMLEEQFPRFIVRKFKEIARDLGVSETDVIKAFERISKLEPRPGRAYSAESPYYIRPDVIVKDVDGRYIYYLNEGETGRLRINDYYRNLLRNSAAVMTDKEREYAVDKYKSALWLIKNIEKRKSTILMVTEAIMDYQRDFLDKGVESLRPLTLKVIADQVGMHESTIARVTNSKYVETPRGIFSLKYFFSSSLETSEGEAASSRSIREKIRLMIEAEDLRKPLSDQKIAAMLSQSGVTIARRTVAKYREQMKILPAKMRKLMKKSGK
ncbi:MAG: RNA polymerase factor sigma-54 [Candidatus Sumerlaeota bacterium]|nr:RNA polymerase factor sigma-54 [Candidatus Sumerlaeota bacterium]